MLIKYKNFVPELLSNNIFIANGSKIIGNVTLGENSNIWFNAILRGDEEKIIIGKNTNVQDNCTVHVSDGFPTILGDNVTIGHNAIIHGCIIEDNCLIGMGATVLDGAIIGEGSIVGANALVTGKTIIPPNSLVLGSPAKVVKEIDVQLSNIEHAKNYVILSKNYM